MNREIITDPLSPEDLWQDFKTNIATLQGLDVSEVSVLYGFSWGAEFYDGTWEERLVPLEDIEKNILWAMEEGHGALGHDNLYITVPQFDARILYSHETDIHLSFGNRNEFTSTIIERWEENGWFDYGNGIVK